MEEEKKEESVNKEEAAEKEETKETTEEVKEKKEKPAKGKGKKQKEEVDVPEGFIKKKKTLNKVEYGYYNGRKYKKLRNGLGLWADNGTVFVISDLK